MRKAGLSDKEARAITGHKTRAMADRYNIIDVEDIQEAGAKMQAYLEKKKATI